MQPSPGTDLALLLGLTHVVLAEGLADDAYLAARTNGVDGAAPQRRRLVARARAVGHGRAGRRRSGAIARRLAAGGGVYILTGRGVEQHVDGTDTATAAINLALVLGLPGRDDSGYGTLTGQGNGQGGREHGQKCDQLPGYRKITDPAARAHVAGVWGVDAGGIPGPGVPAVELLASLGTARRAARAARARIERRRVRARTSTTCARRSRRLDLLVVSRLLPLRDGGARGCRAAR